MEIAKARKKSSPDLNSKQKISMVCWALQYYDHVKERIIDGGMKAIVDRFSLTKTTIQRIFQEYRDELKKDEIYPDLEPKTKKICGVKSMLSDEVQENIIDLHFLTEGTSPIELFIEQYQSEFGTTISRSAMERYLKEIGASQKVIYLAPSLSANQRFQRMKFILGLIEHRGNGSMQFKKEVRIHVDEKWFFVQDLK
jgi:transposase